MVNTVSTATENDKKQELLNMNWAEFSDEDKKDLASSLSIQNIDEYMNAIQSDDTIDAQKKEEILDNLLDVRKVREKMDNEGADAVVEEAKKVLEIQGEKDLQKEEDLQKVESLKAELDDGDQEEVQEEAKEEQEEAQEEVQEETKEEQEEAQEEVQEETKEEQEEVQNELDHQQVDSLKAELAGKDQELEDKDRRIDSLEKNIAALRSQLRELSGVNAQVLNELRKAKKSKDKETIAKQKTEIKRLQEEKNSIRARYLGALPKFGGDIKTLDTKWIEFKLAGAQSINGQKVLTGPQLRFRQNLRSRKRINTTVKKLNEIGNNPKKGVQFVLTRTFGYDPLNVSGKVGSGFKNLRKFFKIRDVKAFDEMYNKQKKYFIDDLESKMAANSMSEQDKQVVAAVKKRLDYYQAAYKREFIVA